MNGFKFVKLILHSNFPSKMQKKVLILIYDLVLNDENIFPNKPTYMRKSFG